MSECACGQIVARTLVSPLSGLPSTSKSQLAHTLPTHRTALMPQPLQLPNLTYSPSHREPRWHENRHCSPPSATASCRPCSLTVHTPARKEEPAGPLTTSHLELSQAVGQRSRRGRECCCPRKAVWSHLGVQEPGQERARNSKERTLGRYLEERWRSRRDKL